MEKLLSGTKVPAFPALHKSSFDLLDGFDGGTAKECIINIDDHYNYRGTFLFVKKDSGIGFQSFESEIFHGLVKSLPPAKSSLFKAV